MSKNKNYTYLLLGSNDGWRELNLQRAVFYIETTPGILLFSKSPVYEEVFIGKYSPYILNQVLKIYCALPPHYLLERCQKVEKIIGRKKNNRWSKRIIDIDILDYKGFTIATEELILPHPRLHLRPATLQCLSDVQSSWTHPLLKKNIDELLFEIKNKKYTRYKENLI